jgi:hypothetical protein
MLSEKAPWPVFSCVCVGGGLISFPKLSKNWTKKTLKSQLEY